MLLAGAHVAAGAVFGWADTPRLVTPWPLWHQLPDSVEPTVLAWFLILALPLFMFGWLLHWTRRVDELPPAGLFWFGAVAACGLGALFPISGFWVAAGICLWMATGRGGRRG